MAIDSKILEIIIRARDEATKIMDNVGSKMQSVGGGMTKVGGAMTAGLTLPIIGVGAAALNMSTDFNKSMSNVATLIPGNVDRVNDLKSSVQDMAIQTGKSTDDLSNGMYQVISAFGDGKDTVKNLEINAKAAAAGMAETTDAINLTSGVTKAYGDTSKEAVQKASDLALLTVRLGQTTFPELAASVGKVTPLTSSLKISQEELFATMATATGVTGGAAEVSTQLRGVLQSLLAPTDAMAELMKKSGYASGEAMIKQEGLAGTIDTIVDAANKSGMPLQQYISSIEGQTIATALAGNLAGDYKNKLGEMASAAGTTAEAYAEVTSGVNESGFKWEQAKQKMIVMAQKLGDGLAPALLAAGDAAQPLIDGAMNMVNAFSNAPPAVQTTIIAIAGIIAAAGPVLMVLGTLISSVGSIVGAFGAASGSIAAAGGAFAVLTGPIGIVLAIIAAVAAAAYLIYKNWDTIGPYFLEAWETVKQAFNDFWEWAKPYVDMAIKAVSKFIHQELDKIKKFWDENGEQIVQALKNVWAFIKTVAKAGISFLKALWDKFGPQIITTVKRTWDGIKRVIDGVLDIILGFIKVWSSIFTGDWQGAWDGVVRILEGAWSLVTGILETLFAGIITMGEDLVSNMLKIGSDIVNGIWEGISSMASKLRTNVSNFINKNIPEVVRNLLGISSPSTVFMEIAKNVIAGFVVGIEKNAPQLAASVKTFYDKTLQAKENFDARFEELQKSSQEAWNNYSSQVESKINSLYGAFGLFDGAALNFKVTGEQLTTNLRSQIIVFSDWQKDLAGLAAKGIPKEFLEELKAMGPQSASQVRAISDMTTPELNNYVAMWKQKHELAKYEALGQLSSLKLETINTVKSLESEAEPELNALKGLWETAFIGMSSVATKALKTMKEETSKVSKEIRAILEDISPYTRHSPSLVDDVTNGVRRIQNEYNKLGGLSFNPMRAAMAGGTSTTTISFAPGSINISVDQMASDYDAELMGEVFVGYLERKGVKIG